MFPTSTSPARTLPTLHTIPAQGHQRRFVQRKATLLSALSIVLDAGLESGTLVQGSLVQAFETQIAQAWHIPATIAVNSGSTALRLALEALQIEAGREVILPALTFISTAYAVSDARLVPVFVDIDPQTLTIDPQAVRAAITAKTAAIIPVHLFGQMADMQPLLAIAEDDGVLVIEDAAQAHGATYQLPGSAHIPAREYYAGSMGDLGCFSLNGIKNMGALGDGGLITLSTQQLERDPLIVQRLRGLRDLGRAAGHRYVHDAWGMRGRMDEFTALECVQELAELDTWNERRRVIAARYDAALVGSGFQSPVIAPGREHVFFTYVVIAPTRTSRHRFEERLRAAGIEVAETLTLVSNQQVYRSGTLLSRSGSLKTASDLVERISTVPLYPELEEEEIERIVAVLQQCAWEK
jgi:dTDP-4-amino-4,6-dideoxygalactose transaminase